MSGLVRGALLFPGQGSEEPEMGLALARENVRAARLLSIASDVVGLDVPRALERGGRALARTEVIQPVLVAVGLGFAHALERPPELVLGHSLGELTAIAYAFDLSDEEAVALAHARGLAMTEAAAIAPGAMLAIPREDALLADAQSMGLALAADNAADELVLSGSLEVIASIERRAPAARRLRTLGPWHAPSMQHAVAPFRRAIEAVTVSRPLAARTRRAEVWSAIEGPRTLASDEVVEALTRGLVAPVHWRACLARLDAERLETIAIAPPARVLEGLWRRHRRTSS